MNSLWVSMDRKSKQGKISRRRRHRIWSLDSSYATLLHRIIMEVSHHFILLPFRYTFFYVKENDRWKILHHHSSIMPERLAVAQPISETQVRQLFYLWNDALATLDPATVADRCKFCLFVIH